MEKNEMTPTDQGACQLIPAGNTNGNPGTFSWMQAELQKSKKHRWKAGASSFPGFESGFFTSDGKRYIDADQSCTIKW